MHFGRDTFPFFQNESNCTYSSLLPYELSDKSRPLHASRRGLSYVCKSSGLSYSPTLPAQQDLPRPIASHSSTHTRGSFDGLPEGLLVRCLDSLFRVFGLADETGAEMLHVSTLFFGHGPPF